MDVNGNGLPPEVAGITAPPSEIRMVLDLIDIRLWSTVVACGAFLALLLAAAMLHATNEPGWLLWAAAAGAGIALAAGARNAIRCNERIRNMVYERPALEALVDLAKGHDAD
jgi:hypothetical protein